MNSASELLERLLKLYPVKILKGQFDVDGSTQAEKLPEIAAKYSADVIRQFAIDKIGHTKQHTYIFKLGVKFNRSTFDTSGLPMRVSSEFHGDDGNYVFFCFPIVEYDVALLNPYQEFTVHFYQPTRIVVKGRILMIQTTIMERSASAYLPIDKQRKLIDINKRNTEDVFIPEILTEFKRHCAVEICDLNKGVKAMWAANTIDATSVRYKKDKSTATESMDEKFTVKADMPDTYADIIKRPLNKMSFRPLKEEDHFSRSFTVDPSKGEFSMNIYPEDPDQTWNVINEILRNN
ncbi:hypothetical protein GCM10027422_28490 [Hymenobacter arcticus]